MVGCVSWRVWGSLDSLTKEMMEPVCHENLKKHCWLVDIRQRRRLTFRTCVDVGHVRRNKVAQNKGFKAPKRGGPSPIVRLTLTGNHLEYLPSPPIAPRVNHRVTSLFVRGSLFDPHGQSPQESFPSCIFLLVATTLGNPPHPIHLVCGVRSLNLTGNHLE